MDIMKIKIDNFEGPFDLLLHLIKKNKMDIYNIKIFDITSQYLEHLETMKEMDLEITSEFIVIAATLLEIKSRTLLPKIKNDEESDEDPQLSLVEKLIRYKRFKGAAEVLREKSLYNGIVFSKKPEIIEEKKVDKNNDDIFKNITMLDLYNIYNQLIEQMKNKLNESNVGNMSKTVEMDKYKIEDKIIFIKSLLESKDIYSFRDIISECESKIETIVTFLALLELIKDKQVKVSQDNSFEEIFIERINEDE